jgi:uncharacterized membrane protein YphA (DoxX/SURF4 family)
VNADFRNRQLPYSNPLANALVVIVGVLAIAISFVIGVFALFALIAAVVILGAIIGLRLFWTNRRPRKARGSENAGRRPVRGNAGNPAVIEGEYRDVSAREGKRRPPQT